MHSIAQIKLAHSDNSLHSEEEIASLYQVSEWIPVPISQKSILICRHLELASVSDQFLCWNRNVHSTQLSTEVIHDPPCIVQFPESYLNFNHLLLKNLLHQIWLQTSMKFFYLFLFTDHLTKLVWFNLHFPF